MLGTPWTRKMQGRSLGYQKEEWAIGWVEVLLYFVTWSPDVSYTPFINDHGTIGWWCWSFRLGLTVVAEPNEELITVRCTAEQD